MGRVLGRVHRDRANMSFCIVIVFFAIFFVIVLTEIFLIDQSSRSKNRRSHHTRLRNYYEDAVIIAQHAEDYLVYQGLSEEGRSRAGFAPTFRTPNISIAPGDGIWQSVLGTRYKFFVFSAYYDWRGMRMVRVIGATKTRGADRVWCHFWYSSANASRASTVLAKVKVIRENWNLKYSACFILCPLQANASVPDSVSIVTRSAASPSNRLVVNLHSLQGLRPTAPPARIGVCVKPLHFTYNKSLHILEFIELNSLLGMDHITFYNDSIGSNVDCILEHYKYEGKTTILPWKLDMASQKEIRTEGLFAALNDCLYRSMYKFSHVALIDLDEFIIPTHNDTIQQFIQWMGSRLDTKMTGSYSFQNAFFYLQWPDDVTAQSHPLERSLTVLRKTRRRAKLHPHKQRSKYLCRPEFVIEVGNHFVWEFLPGHGTLNVPSDSALLNHYRVCEFGGDDCVKSASVVDRTALRYRDRLVERIQRKWELLQASCSLPPLQSFLPPLRRPRKKTPATKTR